MKNSAMKRDEHHGLPVIEGLCAPHVVDTVVMATKLRSASDDHASLMIVNECDVDTKVSVT